MCESVTERIRRECVRERGEYVCERERERGRMGVRNDSVCERERNV